MNDFVKHKENLLVDGFTILSSIYSDEEIKQILATIENADKWDPLESTCRHASLSIL